MTFKPKAIGPTGAMPAGTARPTKQDFFVPTKLPEQQPVKQAPVVAEAPKLKVFMPSGALKGEKVIIDIPTLEQLRTFEPSSEVQDLVAVRELLIRTLPPKSVKCDWSDLGIAEQKDAAKLASRFLDITKKRAFNDAQSLLQRVNEIADKLHDWFEPKFFSSSETKFNDYVKQLELCVSNLKTVNVQLEPSIKDLSELSVNVVRVEYQVRVLLISNRVLSRLRPEEQDVLDLRLASIAKSWNNLIEMKLTADSLEQSMRRVQALLVDTVLTMIPSWISVTTLHYLRDDTNKVLAKNKLEEFRANLKGVI